MFQSDTRCSGCRNWVTIYIEADSLPSKTKRFQFICTCHRVVENTGGSFEEVRSMPVGGIVGQLVTA